MKAKEDAKGGGHPLQQGRGESESSRVPQSGVHGGLSTSPTPLTGTPLTDPCPSSPQSVCPEMLKPALELRGGFSFENCQRNTSLEGLLPEFRIPHARKTGTTIAGLVFRDGVILGADTRATNDSVVADKSCQKIHFIAPNIYCCGAGVAADTEMTTRMAASNMELHSLATGREPRVATVTRVLRQTLFRCGGGAQSTRPEAAGGSAERRQRKERGCDLQGDRKRPAQEKSGTGRGGARVQGWRCRGWARLRMTTPTRAQVPGPRGRVADRGRSRPAWTAALRGAPSRLLQPSALHRSG